MKKAKIYMLVVLGLISIQSNCRNSYKLTAKFESDTSNTFPDVSLPGNPDGDRIDWYGSSNSMLQVVSRTNSEGETSNWLQLNQTTNDPQFYPGLLSFVPAPETSDGVGYTVNWKGYIDVPLGADNLLDILVSVSEGESHRSDRVISFAMRPERLVDGERSRKYGIYLLENGSYSNTALGYVRTGGPHSISIFLFEETREYHIVGFGETIVRNFPEEIELNRPSLHFIFDGFPGIGVYRMDNVFILQGDRTISE
ncbi:hypothetical protein [Zobellia alginiliquefaciens]|uniref:hypothetical protein n=1 Tax=Zobellia alginiliquefaciens TaxID=3032586 RepID=UPI0023E3B913|nr:hypothetical protein [Zobellia alginiliquefaciens]